jgi:hypothetical protein
LQQYDDRRLRAFVLDEHSALLVCTVGDDLSPVQFEEFAGDISME